jgi:hypothetical protein
MRKWIQRALGLGVVIWALSMGGCGLAYRAGSQIKTTHMKEQLKVGELAHEVHDDWGEPDIRKDLGPNAELWSYARHPNNKDIAAGIFYTSTKSGDESEFLDLKFVNGQLVSWAETEHTMPAKQGSGFSYGFGPGGTASPVQHY